MAAHERGIYLKCVLSDQAWLSVFSGFDLAYICSFGLIGQYVYENVKA
jgi:hypothetical protein